MSRSMFSTSRCARWTLATLVLVGTSIAGCSSGERASRPPAAPGAAMPPTTVYPSEAAAPPPPASASPAPTHRADVAAQVQRGATLYAQLCASCHGAGGQGGPKAPAVVGSGALPASPPAGATLRTGSFTMAKDVGMFVMNHMPPGGPKTPSDQVAAILAYLLQSNGITPPAPIDPTVAATIRLR